MREIRLGLVGCGSHVRNRLPYLLNGTGASIVAVADPVEEQRRGIGVDATPFVDHRAMLEAAIRALTEQIRAMGQ